MNRRDFIKNGTMAAIAALVPIVGKPGKADVDCAWLGLTKDRIGNFNLWISTDGIQLFYTPEDEACAGKEHAYQMEKWNIPLDRLKQFSEQLANIIRQMERSKEGE